MVTFVTERNYAHAVAGEVRAEMARQWKTVVDLAAALNVSRETARLRYDGSTSYDLIELAQVAAWLGVDPRQFAGTTERAAS